MEDQIQTTNTQPDVQRSNGAGRSSVDDLVDRGRQTARALTEQTKVGIRQPTTMAALTGGAVVASAMFFGLAPTALGALAAYITYRNLRQQGSDEEREDREMPIGAS